MVICVCVCIYIDFDQLSCVCVCVCVQWCVVCVRVFSGVLCVCVCVQWCCVCVFSGVLRVCVRVLCVRHGLASQTTYSVDKRFKLNGHHRMQYNAIYTHTLE